MARTTVASQAFIGSYPTLPVGSGVADIDFTPDTDPTDRSTPLVDNKTVVLAYNTDVSAHTITINSAPDSLNREGDITAYSVAAGKVAAFGPFRTTGWAIGGVLEIDVSDPKLTLAVVQLP